MERSFAEIEGSAENNYIIEEVPYEGDQSSEFDGILQKEKCLYAVEQGFSERTATDIFG